VIPLLSVAGGHRDVGRQLGRLTAATVRRAAAKPFDPELVERYRAVTQRHLPWIVEELEGVAEGARAGPPAVFAASIEELAAVPAPVGCTDLLALGDATRNGHVLVAHNNDLGADVEEDVVAIEWRVEGEPVVFTLGVGPWISVGWNDAGLSVTGNELAPRDERVGIPRLLQVRDVLTRRTLGEAVDAVLHPARASSYNWLLAHRDGGAVNVEGSARDAELLEPENGVLAHTNHYTHPRLLELDASTRIPGSRARLERAQELLERKPHDAEALHQALCDEGICRHGDPDGTKTVFWCVADVTEGVVRYGRGTPCTSPPQTYRFAA
jgi:isopenicillin-N N-acyltransferase like protein